MIQATSGVLDTIAAAVEKHERIGTIAREIEHRRWELNALGNLGNAWAVLGEERKATVFYEQALTAFYDQWKHEPLVIDKWFAVQARSPGEDVLGRVMGLTAHPAFDSKNPNRLRALVSTFASFNPARFHDPSGAGYRFLADQILATDGFNPMTAARLVEPLGGWRRYTPQLGTLMKAELERILAHAGLSKNVFELVSRSLAED